MSEIEQQVLKRYGKVEPGTVICTITTAIAKVVELSDEELAEIEREMP